MCGQPSADELEAVSIMAGEDETFAYYANVRWRDSTRRQLLFFTLFYPTTSTIEQSMQLCISNRHEHVAPDVEQKIKKEKLDKNNNNNKNRLKKKGKSCRAGASIASRRQRERERYG